MADEVYKILQSRLRKQAQHDNSTCGDQYDCEGCRQAAKQQITDDSAKRKRPNSTGGEDPLSHKIIEKRRRDRMNSCLADLSHLIPSNYLKKGRGRIEKTEIVEMAIKHIKHLHELLPNNSSNAETNSEKTQTGSNWQCPQEVESFKNGFNECLAEAVHFLVEKEHIPPENPLCSRLVANLKRYLDSKNQQKSSSEPDSDYSSMRSESSAANSEVSSIVSNPSTTTQRNYPPMRIHPSPVSSNNIPSLSESGHVTAAGAIKRRSSEEVNSGGKFKFKDSMRDRFSHEFETVTENASEIQANETNPEFHLKRRRQSSRSCEHGDDAKPCTSQQISGKLHSDSEKDPGKNVPIFALHPKGSHYIPLSVTDEVIQPYLHLFDQGSELPLMLHPITISVNFCGPIRIAAGVRQVISHRNIQGPDIKEDRE